MDVFNIICGLVTIGSSVFTLWIYWESKSKEAVEKERKAQLSARLNDFLNTATAAELQAKLLAGVSDREETAKKELKHLSVALLTTINGLQKSLSEELQEREGQEYGIPSTYLKLRSVPKPTNTSQASVE